VSDLRTRNAGILIFDDVEVLDFCGPFEVFATAVVNEGRPDEQSLYHVVTIADTMREIRARGGLQVVPHHTVDDHPALDLLVVPGGYGTRRELGNERLLDWLASQAGKVELMTSVCTGAFLLAKRGLLDGKRATTHWASIGYMREHFPAVDTVDHQRVVDQGAVITSAGVSAGIDMALYVIERQHGRAIAEETARGMEYDWRG
jgi:transcriptional regulator GlxA family with amidase domain